MLNKIVIVVLLALSLGACTKEALLNETQEVKAGIWEFSDVKRFTLEVTDTLTPYNFSAQFRHGGNYEYQNLIILFKTYYPDNKFTTDTIDCPLSAPSGKWYGNGLGDILDISVLFKRNVQFEQTGTYNFEIQHAMRPNTIHEIYDVGLLIESAYD